MWARRTDCCMLFSRRMTFSLCENSWASQKRKWIYVAMTWSMPPLSIWREELSPSSLAGPLDRWLMRIQPSTHLRGRTWSVWWFCSNFFGNHLFTIGSQFPYLMRLPVNATNPPVFTHQMSVCNPVKMSRLVTLPFLLKSLEIIISFEGWGCLGLIIPHPDRLNTSTDML